MILFQACPECLRGDLAIERVHGRFNCACLQCGYSGEMQSVYPLPRPTWPEELPPSACSSASRTSSRASRSLSTSLRT